MTYVPQSPPRATRIFKSGRWSSPAQTQYASLMPNGGTAQLSRSPRTLARNALANCNDHCNLRNTLVRRARDPPRGLGSAFEAGRPPPTWVLGARESTLSHSDQIFGPSCNRLSRPAQHIDQLSRVGAYGAARFLFSAPAQHDYVRRVPRGAAASVLLYQTPPSICGFHTEVHYASPVPYTTPLRYGAQYVNFHVRPTPSEKTRNAPR